MNRPILVDSNVFIRLLRAKRDPALSLFEHYDTIHLATCGMVRMEVLRGVRLPSVRERLAAFLDAMLYVPADAALWDEAAALAAQADRAGFPVPNPDAVIAACARRLGAVILTADADFTRMPNVDVITPPPSLIG